MTPPACFIWGGSMGEFARNMVSQRRNTWRTWSHRKKHRSHPCSHHSTPKHFFTITPPHGTQSHSSPGFLFVSIVTTNTFLHSRRRTHSRLIHLQGFHLWALWLRTRFYKHAVALLRSHIIQPLYHTPFTHHSHTIQPQWHHNDTIIIHGLRPRCKHIWSHTMNTQWHHNDTILNAIILCSIYWLFTRGAPWFWTHFSLIFIDFHCLNPGTPQPEGRGPPMLTQSSHNSTIIDTFIYWLFTREDPWFFLR